jgi:hypothetical protein
MIVVVTVFGDAAQLVGFGGESFFSSTSLSVSG